MKNVIGKLSEIKNGEVGMIIFSDLKQEIIMSVNEELTVPLASAAKVAIAFCVAKIVENGHHHWNEMVEDITFNPKEDSHEIYPHLQGMNSLALRDAVEVMIACHDSFVANAVVKHYGGWKRINEDLKSYFNTMNVTENPLDMDNSGELSQLIELIRFIYQGYKMNQQIWIPIINGMVRQQGQTEGIPNYVLHHMTGGLKQVVVDIGILGEFSQNPFLYVIGARNLPDRIDNQFADEKISEAMRLVYEEYRKQA
ncbi:serine hydrolase [Bacillus salitolerans]|uniref:Serine hydrolase n=1 Tax=Bacillus salitolerans TaxID=1437434 RepID=A0ABW4LUN6_9BACI